jgi:L-methionine (R)-S-oxide reductase
MSRKQVYSDLKQKINAIFDPELTIETNILQIISLIKNDLNLYWAGIYVLHENHLEIWLYQGETPCTKIALGKGVCGTAANEKKTIIVDDVSEFPGYIACHAAPQSEIVVPGFINNRVAFVLDCDSVEKAFFNSSDKKYLEEIVNEIAVIIKNDNAIRKNYLNQF